jgi:hypothetical protein
VALIKLVNEPINAAYCYSSKDAPILNSAV